MIVVLYNKVSQCKCGGENFTLVDTDSYTYRCNECRRLTSEGEFLELLTDAVYRNSLEDAKFGG